jgi:hypothetical protein
VDSALLWLSVVSRVDAQMGGVSICKKHTARWGGGERKGERGMRGEGEEHVAMAESARRRRVTPALILRDWQMSSRGLQ